MATTVPVQSSQLFVEAQTMQQQPPTNLRFVKNLAVTQLCIGVISATIGIVVLAFFQRLIFHDYTGAILWAGGWMYLTGLIGLFHAKNGRKLSCAYMTLSVISTCTALVTGFFSGFGVLYFVFAGVCDDDGYNYAGDCSYRRQGIGLSVSLFIFMIIEFIVSIVAAVLCCKNNGCRCCECCAQPPGVVIQQQPYLAISYPSGGYPSYTQYGIQIAPQYGVHIQQAPQLEVQQASQPYIQPGGIQPINLALAYPAQQTNAMDLVKPPAYDGQN